LKKPTSSDVARLSGVSQSAVSRAFTPGASISEATRQRILEAAEAIGYRPNALARSLISGRSRLIGLVLVDRGIQTCEILSRSLRQRGYFAIVFLVQPDEPDLEAVIDDLVDYQVDAILLGSLPAPGRSITRCQRAGVPLIQFGTCRKVDGVDAVIFDEHAGGAAVARHLVGGGHRRIVHLAARGRACTGKAIEGLTAALAASGLRLASRAEVGADPASVAGAVRDLFAGRDGERPDAVFCDGDDIAFCAIDTLRREMGLDLPADVSVVGFEDAPMARWPVWDLTTVRLDTDLLVDRTLDLLLARLNGGEVEEVMIDCPLIERGSSRRPAAHPG
jgi:DNA-binding LacI/PurR family transcriptional regulator